MRRLATALLVVLGLAVVGSAPAQDREPSQRQTLVDLAYVIGRSHALRQACAGAGDQFWRGRMSQLIHAESPDAAFNRRMAESFNTGFIAGQSAFPSCTPESRREEARVAVHGRALAQALTRGN